MNLSLRNPTSGSMSDNPWRTVLEYQLGFGPELREGPPPKDHAVARGLAVGLAIGVTCSVSFFSFLKWLMG